MRLPPFDLERFFGRFEFEVPYLLGSSDAESLTVAELLALEPGADERLRGLRLGYSESEGRPELRQALSGLYESIGPEGVLVHAAAVEAIFVFVNAVLEPGDRVVVQAPCFQPLAEIPRAAGASVELWWARPEEGWEPDLGELERLLRPGCRLLVVNFPHNPTGYLPGRAYFDRLVGLAEEHGAVLLCDEIFRLLEHDPGRRLPAACDLYPKAVSLGGMSKVFGLPGVRVGWIATRDRELLRAALGFKDYTTTCAATVAEFLAAVAVRNRERILDRNRDLVLRNLGLLRALVERRPDLLEWVAPLGGTIAFSQLKVAGDREARCEEVAERAGVLVIPGGLFGMPEHVRIGYGRANFPKGLERLERSLARLPVA